jgi:hypothetical protein
MVTNIIMKANYYNSRYLREARGNDVKIAFVRRANRRGDNNYEPVVIVSDAYPSDEYDGEVCYDVLSLGTCYENGAKPSEIAFMDLDTIQDYADLTILMPKEWHSEKNGFVATYGPDGDGPSFSWNSDIFSSSKYGAKTIKQLLNLWVEAEGKFGKRSGRYGL